MKQDNPLLKVIASSVAVPDPVRKAPEKAMPTLSSSPSSASVSTPSASVKPASAPVAKPALGKVTETTVAKPELGKPAAIPAKASAAQQGTASPALAAATAAPLASAVVMPKSVTPLEKAGATVPPTDWLTKPQDRFSFFDRLLMSHPVPTFTRLDR